MARLCIIIITMLYVKREFKKVNPNSVNRQPLPSTIIMLSHLNEDDIPGTKLPKPPEQCTVPVLKRWLSCRGGKVTGKRKELVET